MDHPSPSSRLVNTGQCTQLRHKGMYVFTDPADDRARDPAEPTAYWCLCTMKAVGPDGQPASAEACQPGRECCEH